jgi:glycosyltransferase involved in cell wall biosynthesis
MHMVDTLELGGAERMAVNLTNLLPRDQFMPYLCTTRSDGPLATLVSTDVLRLSLNRRNRFDPSAIARLAEFVRHHGIRILHAHGSSLFLASIVSRFSNVRVLWHDHYGPCELNDRPAWMYRLAVRRIAGAIVVNQLLSEWARTRLFLPPERVWFIPNLVDVRVTGGFPLLVPGTVGKRIVCVANLRPQKDYFTLLAAMRLVLAKVPDAHLLIVGARSDGNYQDTVLAEIAALGLSGNVTFLGSRNDVPDLLRLCDIAVLSSVSEGLPLSLLEYGAMGLPTVATAVGECPEVLDNGRAGILVPPKSPERLANALIGLLHSAEQRRVLGRSLHERVATRYGPRAIVDQFCQVYKSVLSD